MILCILMVLVVEGVALFIAVSQFVVTDEKCAGITLICLVIIGLGKLLNYFNSRLEPQF